MTLVFVLGAHAREREIPRRREKIKIKRRTEGGWGVGGKGIVLV